MKAVESIGLLGFGEVGQILATDLLVASTVEIYVFDAQFVDDCMLHAIFWVTCGGTDRIGCRWLLLCAAFYSCVILVNA